MLRRKSVSSSDPVHSGYFNFGPKASSPQELTQATLTMQAFVCKLNASLRAIMPQATWNAVCVGWNTLSGMHRDSGNQPGSMNHTFCIGDFKGGALWLENMHGGAAASLPGGQVVTGDVVDTFCRPTSFPCHLWHQTMPYTGERWVITAYTLAGGQPKVLLPLGFPCCSDSPELSSAVSALEPHAQAAGPLPQSPSPPTSGSSSLPLVGSASSPASPATQPSKRPRCEPTPAARHGKPLFLEICSGSALLSYVAKEAGYIAVPIDWHHNRQKSCVHTLQLDLRLASTWSFLRRTCSSCNVAWIHMAPPCGTASRKLLGSSIL